MKKATRTPDVRLQLPIRNSRQLTVQNRTSKAHEQQARILLLLLFLFLTFGCSERRSGEDLAERRRQRIITLAPNLTEIVTAIGCGDRLIATDDDSDWPASIRRLPKVGRGLTPNIERITRLRPDIVLASSSADQRVLRAMLARVNIPLHVERTDRLADLPAAAARLGDAIGCEGAAAWGRSFAAELLAQRRARSKKPAVLFLAWADPLYVAGSNTFADDLLAAAGATNAASDVSGWPQYSIEAVAAHPPDVVLFPTEAFTHEAFVQMLEEHPVWRTTPAVRSGHVLVVDEDAFTHAGPRTIEAVRVLNQSLDQLGYE